MPDIAPILNLLVIRSRDMHQAVKFYQTLGLVFDLHSHGTGPNHFSSNSGDFVFEIYESRNEKDVTSQTRFGFRVKNVDRIVPLLHDNGFVIISEPRNSEWGRRAIVKDFDGHSIELVSPDND